MRRHMLGSSPLRIGRWRRNGERDAKNRVDAFAPTRGAHGKNPTPNVTCTVGRLVPAVPFAMRERVAA